MVPVLGLDLATACGWALVEGDRVTRSGCLDLSLKRADHPGQRYLRLARFLQAGPWPAGVVLAVEDVRSHERRKGEKTWVGTTAAHVYGGLRAIAEAWAAAGGVAVVPVGVGEWKASLGCPGGAHATKDSVLAMVRLLGYRPSTQDEADAIGIALHEYRVSQHARRAITLPLAPPRRPSSMKRH